MGRRVKQRYIAFLMFFCRLMYCEQVVDASADLYLPVSCFLQSIPYLLGLAKIKYSAVNALKMFHRVIGSIVHYFICRNSKHMLAYGFGHVTAEIPVNMCGWVKEGRLVRVSCEDDAKRIGIVQQISHLKGAIARVSTKSIRLESAKCYLLMVILFHFPNNIGKAVSAAMQMVVPIVGIQMDHMTFHMDLRVPHPSGKRSNDRAGIGTLRARSHGVCRGEDQVCKRPVSIWHQKPMQGSAHGAELRYEPIRILQAEHSVHMSFRY